MVTYVMVAIDNISVFLSVQGIINTSHSIWRFLYRNKSDGNSCNNILFIIRC